MGGAEQQAGVGLGEEAGVGIARGDRAPASRHGALGVVVQASDQGGHAGDVDDIAHAAEMVGKRQILLGAGVDILTLRVEALLVPICPVPLLADDDAAPEVARLSRADVLLQAPAETVIHEGHCRRTLRHGLQPIGGAGRLFRQEPAVVGIGVSALVLSQPMLQSDFD